LFDLAVNWDSPGKKSNVGPHTKLLLKSELECKLRIEVFPEDKTTASWIKSEFGAALFPSFCAVYLYPFKRTISVQTPN